MNKLHAPHLPCSGLINFYPHGWKVCFVDVAHKLLAAIMYNQTSE